MVRIVSGFDGLLPSPLDDVGRATCQFGTIFFGERGGGVLVLP